MSDESKHEEQPLRHAWQREEPHGTPSMGRRPLRIILGIFFSACLLLLVLDFVIHRHVEHPGERLPIFYALYGFFCSVFLVLSAKEMRHVLMRSEDYYDAE